MAVPGVARASCNPPGVNARWPSPQCTDQASAAMAVSEEAGNETYWCQTFNGGAWQGAGSSLTSTTSYVELSVTCQHTTMGLTSVVPLRAAYPACPSGTVSNGTQCVLPDGTNPYKNCSTCAAGENGTNPIHGALGTKVQTERDLDLGRGLSFVRYYTSAGHWALSGFGQHWRHNFARRVAAIPSADGSITVWAGRPTGDFVRFVVSAAGGVSKDPDIHLQLSRLLDGGGQLIGWRILNAENETETYDSQGRLTELEIDGSNTLHFSYDGQRMMSVLDATGRKLSFTYNSNGRISSVSAPDGVTVAYQYEGIGYYGADNLTKATFAIGTANASARRYLYEDPTFVYSLTGIIDESDNRFATWQYDSVNRGVLSVHGPGDGTIDRVSLVYNPDGTTTVTDALGQTRTFTYALSHGVKRFVGLTNVCSQCNGTSSGRTYDANGNIDVDTDFNGVTTDFDVDGRGLVNQKIESANRATTRRKTQTDWHPIFRSPVERRIYDAANTLVARQTWSYNGRGQALSVSQHDPVAGTVRTTTTVYCEQSDIDTGSCPLLGLVTSIDGPRTDTSDLTTYTYYPADDATCASAPTSCPHRKGDLWKVTDALGHVTETLKYDGAGRVLSIKDANGVFTDFEYHPRGWLTASKVRGPGGGSEADDAITQIAYYPTGLVSSTTLPDGGFTSYVYDAAHRLTDVVDADGNTIHYTLDNAGNRTKEEVKGETGTLKRTLSRVFNQLGQLQTQKDASDHPTGFVYDANGNIDTVTDALNRVTDNDYDPLNRLAKIIQDVGGIAAQTQFHYDTQDRLTAVIDPKGLTTNYGYSAFGDLTRLESPDTGVTTYGYDAAGNRTSALDARNEPVSYSYDPLNRLTSIDYSDTALNVGYAYDTVQADCTVDEAFAVGRLTRIDDGSGSTKYCYDRFGNLTRKVQITNGQSFVLRYAYTKAGQLSGITYPDGTAVDYVRDGLGRATEVGVMPVGGNRETLLHSVTYYPFGPTSGWTFGNGRTFARTLDLDYRMQSIRSTGTGAGGLDLGYAWDAVGNLSGVHAADLSPRITFSYDALSRLTALHDGPTDTAIESYTYDVTGNRTGFTNAGGTQSYEYPSDSHHLTAVSGIARRYDAAGNTTSIGGTAQEFGYNAAGRMNQATRDSVLVMQYAYNGKGEQVRKHLGADNTYTLYDEAGRWIGDYDTSGMPRQQAIWLDDLPVGVVTDGQLHYIEADALGTPRAVIEPQRDVAAWSWDIASEAFGNSPPEQDPDGDSVPFVFNLRFPGQRYDAASGMNYNYFRDYDPRSGRYAQSDPINLASDISTYRYAESDPMTYSDRYGLWGDDVNDLFPKQWSPDRCAYLLNKIQEYRRDIGKRFGELDRNAEKLPHAIGNPRKALRDDRAGHITIINDLDSRARKLEDDYDKHCRNGPPACPTISLPQATPEDVNTAPAMGVGTMLLMAIAAYLALST